MAIVELTTNGGDDLRVFRVTIDRVPHVHEIIRVLVAVNGMTSERCFRVIRVVHNASTEAYPRRVGELDAWVDAEATEWTP